MTVLVTGATGFVGSHVVAALQAAGHGVRVLARSPDKVPRALDPVGCGPVEVVPGDVTDPAAVATAVRGVDAVVHSANVYSWDARRRAEMYRVNVDGTRLVLTTAAEAGCGRIVHVSSTVVLLGSPGPWRVDGPLGADLGTPYVGSKRVADTVAAELAAAGAPVVRTYPGSVWGPCDPGAGEMVETTVGLLSGRLPYWLPGSRLSLVDVRWLARAHVAAVAAPDVPARVLMGGTLLPWPELVAHLRTLTGRALPTPVYVPGWAALGLGWVSDRFAGVLPFRLPQSYESAYALTHFERADDTWALGHAGPHPAVVDTLEAAVRWQAAAGHLTAAQAGRLAG